MPLLAVPNLSEGREAGLIGELEAAFGDGVAVLDRHADPDHNRSVFTLRGEADPLAEALLAGAREAIARIDMRRWEGLHPCVGALDVCPLVWLDPAGRDPACAAALAVAERLGGLGVPVFLYGELATAPERAERSFFRAGGLRRLTARMAGGELRADAGPPVPHPTAGATLVTARPPLAAFNVELDSGEVAIAREVAASLRESGGGLPGVRAIGLSLSSGRAQVSVNVHDPATTPLAVVVEEIRRLAAPLGAAPVEAELVGLVPEPALAGYPSDVPIRGFEPSLQVIERRLAT